MRNNNPHNKIKELYKNITPAMRYKDGDFTQWQKDAKAKLSELLGMDKFEKCDPITEIEYEKETELYKEIRFNFQSEEGYFVPCHFLVPKNASLPAPLMICLQGHSKGMHISLGRPKFEGDEITVSGGDRDFAVQSVKQGLCVLTVEMRDMGECGGTPEGPQCHVPTMANLLIGRTTIGERVWDVMRAIDVLENEFSDYIDKSKIMCMGNSGGGTATFYSASLEERIKVAVPSCSVCSYDASIVAMPHCVCNFIPNIRKYFDMSDLGGLIAPRSLVMVNGQEDGIFPIDSAKETFSHIKELYSHIGCEDNANMVIGEAGHRFYAEKSWKIILKELSKLSK